VSEHDQLLTDLSVYHGRHLDGYRHARQTTERASEATTEALRRALLDYRGLFFDLIESPEGGPGASARAPETAAAEVPAQRPWKQVTQGRHWKSRQPEAGPQESSDVAATRH
jgi:hypothetical protein